MIGQIPVYGVYVTMFTKVQREFAKLFVAYICVLVGFTISYSILFPSSSLLANPFIGFITTLIMMTGADIGVLTSGQSQISLKVSALIVSLLFIIYVTIIVLMNLLAGIAVDDIKKLKKTAEFAKLIRQTEIISRIESALFNRSLPGKLRTFLYNTALVAPNLDNASIIVKPFHEREKKLPRDILTLAFKVAKQSCNNERNLVNKSIHKYAPQDSSYFFSVEETPDNSDIECNVSPEISTNLKKTISKDEMFAEMYEIVINLTSEIRHIKALLLIARNIR